MLEIHRGDGSIPCAGQDRKCDHGAVALLNFCLRWHRLQDMMNQLDAYLAASGDANGSDTLHPDRLGRSEAQIELKVVVEWAAIVDDDDRGFVVRGFVTISRVPKGSVR